MVRNVRPGHRTENPALPLAVDGASSPARRILLALARLGIGVALLAYLVESRIINLRTLGSLVAAWPLTLAAVALLLLDMGMMALRLSLLFRPQALRLSLDSAFRLTLTGQFFTAFLPGGAGGDVVKLYYATRENQGRRVEIATIVLLDRAIGLFSLLLLPLLIAPFFLPVVRASAVLRGLLMTAALLALALVAAGFAVSSSYAARHRLTQRLLELAPGGSHARRMMGTLRSYRRYPRTLAAALGLSLAGNLMALASTIAVGLGMSPGAEAGRMALLIPLGQVANSLPLTPGGLGVGEAAFGLLFSLAGLTRGADILLGWRLVTLLVGMLGLFYYLQGLRRSVSVGQVLSNCD